MILFIDLSILLPNEESESIPYSLGILRCAQVAKEQGYQVKVLQNIKYKNINNWVNELSNLILEEQSNVLCFSSRCDYYPFLLKIISNIKECNNKKKVILGGIQATLTDSITLDKFPYIDFISRDEGEANLPLLLDAIINNSTDFSNIPSITYKRNNEIIRTASPTSMCDINYQIALELIEYSESSVEEILCVEVGRGCTFNCQFCCTSTMWRRNYRLCSASSVYSNMKKLSEKYKISHFKFIHDNFLSNPQYKKFLAEFNNELNFTWECSARIDNLLLCDLEMLSKKGCTSVYCGIESGSKKMQKVYHKNIDLDKVDKALIALAEYNISCTFSFIIGHPEETLSDIEETIQLAVKSKMHHNCLNIQIHKLAAQVGSELFDIYKENLVFDINISDQASTLDNMRDVIDLIDNKFLFSSFYSFDNLPKENYAVVNECQKITYIINQFSFLINYLYDKTGRKMTQIVMKLIEFDNAIQLISYLRNICKDYPNLEFKQITNLILKSNVRSKEQKIA